MKSLQRDSLMSRRLSEDTVAGANVKEKAAACSVRDDTCGSREMILSGIIYPTQRNARPWRPTLIS
jgi:hypothetical protein